MGCISILRHRSLTQPIYRWESGKRQSEVPAVVSIAMSGPAIAGTLVLMSAKSQMILHRF